MTPQTLGMYYYGFSKLVKTDRRYSGHNVFKEICKYLVSADGSMTRDEVGETDYDFSTGLQTTGLIVYSAKHLRYDKLDKHH